MNGEKVSEHSAGLATLGPASGTRRGSITRLAGITYASTLLGLLTGPIVARVLGADGRGEYAAVLIYYSSVVAILSLGMGLTVNNALLGQRRDPGVVFGVVLKFCAALFIPSLSIAAVAALLSTNLTTAGTVALTAFIATAPVGVLQVCLNQFLICEGALGTLALVRMFPLVLNAVGVVLLALFGLLTVATYLGLTFVGTVLSAALVVYGVRIRPRRGGSLLPQLRFGIRAYPGSLAGLGNSQLDQLLIAPLLGVTDLGHYAVAVTIAGLPIGLAQALSARATHDMSLPGGGLDAVATAQAIRRSIVLVTAVTAALALATPILIPVLYGAEFKPSVQLCLILLPGSVATALSLFTSTALIIAGRPGAASIAQLMAFAVTGIGLAVTLPVLGVTGAAVTTLSAYVARAGLEVRALRRLGVRGLRPSPGDVVDVTREVGTKLLQSVRQTSKRGWGRGG